MIGAVDRQRQYPLGDAVELAKLDIDPYPTFKALLEYEPVSWIGEIGMWYVTRRADVLDILADTENFTVVSDQSLIREAVGHNMLTTDGAEQYRLRHPFIHPFAPHTLRQSATVMIADLADKLIDAFFTRGQADIKAEFADLLSIQTVMGILGLPIADFDQVRRWVTDMNRIMSNFRGDPEVRRQGQQSRREFADYVLNHLDELRTNSDDSILSQIIHADDQPLTDAELVDSARVIIFGGVESTSAMITNTLWALLQHPDQFDQILQNPALLPNAIEEGLRWESPVQTCTRHLTREAVVSGVTLAEGETLQCMLGAANRDPSFFADPDRFDIHRRNAPDHLAFANGKHFCLGAGLARLEGQIGLRRLFERLPDLRLVEDAHSAPRGYEFRSSPALTLAWRV